MERTVSKSDREHRSAGKQRNSERNTERSSAGQQSTAALHRSVGNQAVKALHEHGQLQANLEVSQPSDPAEREAQRVADTVLAMDEPGSKNQAETVVNRQPSGGGDGTVTDATESDIRSVTSGGTQLSESTRSYFEPRFGRSFGDVRVHTGPQADAAARSIQAEAFTYGSDVVFRSGTYQPNTPGGRELLAHELTHVVQQTAGAGSQADTGKRWSDGTVHRRLPDNNTSYSSADAERENEQQEQRNQRRNQIDEPFAIRGNTGGGSRTDVESLLGAVVQTANRYAGSDNEVRIVVEGRASQEGDREYNAGLSLRRAEAVKAAIEGRIDDSTDSITVEVETVPRGEGSRSSAEYWRDRRATVYVERHLMQLNEPGAIERPEPEITREDKIEFIRENAGDPEVDAAFGLMSIKRGIGDLKPYPTEWSDLEIQSPEEVYEETAVDAYDYLQRARQLEEARGESTDFDGSTGRSESRELIQIGSVFFPQDSADL